PAHAGGRRFGQRARSARPRPPGGGQRRGEPPRGSGAGAGGRFRGARRGPARGARRAGGSGGSRQHRAHPRALPRRSSMCGISGFLNRDREQPADAGLLERMTSAIAHRGPDGNGHFVEGPVALGHRRLSIIDLSQNGAQPMQNEDGRVTITFNGEIYNYLPLREELLARGHVFRSRCDTEVLVHGYEEWGESLPERLAGMFALAIWDARRQRLFLARDRLGKKPLYYHLGRERFAFGSEIKSLLEDPSVPRELDGAALDLYLSARYVPAPLTMFAGIRKLPPAHSAVYEKGELKIRRYWKCEH